MTENIVTQVSTKEYREGWDRIFGGNVWRCPKCGKEVDYGEEIPLLKHVKTYCSIAGKNVQMVRV